MVLMRQNDRLATPTQEIQTNLRFIKIVGDLSDVTLVYDNKLPFVKIPVAKQLFHLMNLYVYI